MDYCYTHQAMEPTAPSLEDITRETEKHVLLMAKTAIGRWDTSHDVLMDLPMDEIMKMSCDKLRAMRITEMTENGLLRISSDGKLQYPPFS